MCLNVIALNVSLNVLLLSGILLTDPAEKSPVFIIDHGGYVGLDMFVFHEN